MAYWRIHVCVRHIVISQNLTGKRTNQFFQKMQCRPVNVAFFSHNTENFATGSVTADITQAGLIHKLRNREPARTSES